MIKIENFWYLNEEQYFIKKNIDIKLIRPLINIFKNSLIFIFLVYEHIFCIVSIYVRLLKFEFMR